MKLNGKKLDCPNEEIIVIPRGNGDDIILRARAILSFEEFNRLYPEPTAPKKMAAGGTWVEDQEDPDFKASFEERELAEFNWMIYKSLLATPGLEFETVDAGDPKTWGLVEKELKDSGFSQVEVNRITNGVLAANCLDEKKLDAARKSFTLSQAQSQPS